MRALIQRVSSSQVTVDDKVIGKIGQGFTVLVGYTHTDTPLLNEKMVDKILNLRVFADDAGKMNLSIKEAGGSLLVVSQFTLYGNVSSGRRPDFLKSAKPELAIPLYNDFVEKLKKHIKVETGEFGAMMQVSLVNEGPVTLMIEFES